MTRSVTTVIHLTVEETKRALLRHLTVEETKRALLREACMLEEKLAKKTMNDLMKNSHMEFSPKGESTIIITFPKDVIKE